MNLVLFHGRGSPAVRQATGSGLSGHFFAAPVRAGRAGSGCGDRAGRRTPARPPPGRRRPHRRCGRAARRPGRGAARGGCAGTRCTASTAAQCTNRLPCLVIRPRWQVVSDSRCLGVSPAQLANCSGRAKRVTSPISATNTAARSLPPREWPGSRRTRGLPVPRMLLRIVRLAVVITQSWWEVRAEWGRCPSAAVGG